MDGNGSKNDTAPDRLLSNRDDPDQAIEVTPSPIPICAPFGIYPIKNIKKKENEKWKMKNGKLKK